MECGKVSFGLVNEEDQDFPCLIPKLLEYALIIKHRSGRILTRVEKRVIFGENIDPKMVSTSYIERQNLTYRQDNNRFTKGCWLFRGRRTVRSTNDLIIP